MHIPLKQPVEMLSVAKIPTKNAAGEEYAHTIEPEIALVNIPRLARFTPKTLSKRRCLWNSTLVILGILLFLGQRDLTTWNALAERGMTVPATVYGGTGKYMGDVLFSYPGDSGTVYSEIAPEKIEGGTTAIGETFPLTYLPGTQGTAWQPKEDMEGPRNLRIILWGTALVVLSAFLGTLITIFEKCWNQQLHLLQEGVAVHGLARSGEINEMVNPPQYHIQYTYWVGTGTETGKAQVNMAEYRTVTTENPYLTVLYDVIDPSRSKPYFQCDAAYLFTK